MNPSEQPQAASTPVAANGEAYPLADKLPASPALPFVVNEQRLTHGHNQYVISGRFKNRLRALDFARFIHRTGSRDDLAVLVADHLWAGSNFKTIANDLNLRRADIAKAWARAKSWIRAWNEATAETTA